ncbi:hypothetical protein V8D89_016082 [Ganoderma adspersum]
MKGNEVGPLFFIPFNVKYQPRTTLIGLLNHYKFTCLPRVALGAIWENNTHIHNWRAEHSLKAPIPPYNTEAVRPLEFDHAAFNASVEIRKERLGNLQADDKDPTFGILDRNKVRTKWWEAYPEYPDVDTSIALRAAGRVPAPSSSSSLRSSTGMSPKVAETPEPQDVQREHSRTRAPGHGMARRGRSAARSSTQADPAAMTDTEGEDEVDDDKEQEELAAPRTRQSTQARRQTSRAGQMPKVKAKVASEGKASSLAAKGKHKAQGDAAEAEEAPEAKCPRGAYEMPQHAVRWMWMLHPRPCEGCVGSQSPCHYSGLGSTSCQCCIAKKVQCSLTVSGGNIASAYLAYEYYYHCVHELGNKSIKHPRTVPMGFVVPVWFVAQYHTITKQQQQSKGPTAEEIALQDMDVDEGRPKNTEKNTEKRNRKTHKRGPPGVRVLPGTEAATEPDSHTGQSGRSDERPRARSPSPVLQGRPVVPVVQERPQTVAGGSSTLGSATEAQAGPTRRFQTRPAARAAVETRAGSQSRSTGPSRSHPSSCPTTPPASTPAGSSVYRGLMDEEPVHRAYPPGYRSAIFPPEEQLVEEQAQ